MHQLEDELVLVFVLLELVVVFVLLKKEACAQPIAALNPVDVLVEAPLQVRGVRVHDAELLKEVEVSHVDDGARHLLEAHIGDLAE